MPGKVQLDVFVFSEQFVILPLPIIFIIFFPSFLIINRRNGV